MTCHCRNKLLSVATVLVDPAFIYLMSRWCRLIGRSQRKVDPQFSMSWRFGPQVVATTHDMDWVIPKFESVYVVM